MQRIVRIGVGGLVGVSAAIMLLAGGCQDILDFDNLPTTGSSSSSSSSSSGSGGNGGEGGGTSSSSSSSSGNPSGCVSNTDCVTPSPICDVPKGQCVECLEASDCSLKEGTVCSGGTCACPTPGDSYCVDPARCVDLQTAMLDCGLCDHPCFGSCVTGQCADAWQPTPWKNAPQARSNHVAVWTGSLMIVWGGDVGNGNTSTGGMLDTAGYKWNPTSNSNAPTPRKDARAIWTGNKMVVWGGDNGGPLNTGGIFDPTTNTWTATSPVNAPSPRFGHSIVWTGTKMLVWGGTDGINYFADGAAYDVGTDAWETIPVNGLPPSARAYHSAIWTNTDMIVFGGHGFDGVGFGYLGDGGEFDPAAGSWVSVKDGQPPPRARHGSAWTGTEMIIWGGQDSNGMSPTGARYKPKIDWSAITSDSAPSLRQYHTHVWMTPANRLVVWGGQDGVGTPLDSGALYDPANNKWSAKPIPSGPVGRTHHSSVNADGKLIVFGGLTSKGLTNTGATLDPAVIQ